MSAPRAKRNVGGRWVWWREVMLRLAIAALVVLAFRLFGVNHAVRFLRLHAVNRSPVAGIIGAMLCAMGVGLAILARLHLGRNWGPPMSRKAEPELVTSGPYAIIRHPIYSGILLAAIGAAVGQSVVWVLALLLWLPYLIYSARHEEKRMLAQFPDRYGAYMKRTRMLVPYIL